MPVWRGGRDVTENYTPYAFSNNIRLMLKKILMGACAVSGGIIGESAMKSGDYNVTIAGCPPNPYTILSALIKARGE